MCHAYLDAFEREREGFGKDGTEAVTVHVAQHTPDGGETLQVAVYLRFDEIAAMKDEVCLAETS